MMIGPVIKISLNSPYLVFMVSHLHQQMNQKYDKSLLPNAISDGYVKRQRNPKRLRKIKPHGKLVLVSSTGFPCFHL